MLRAVLGEELLEVQDDPGNPNRQLARLSDDRVLDTRISGRRSETPNPNAFLADELTDLVEEAVLLEFERLSARAWEEGRARGGS